MIVRSWTVKEIMFASFAVELCNPALVNPWCNIAEISAMLHHVCKWFVMCLEIWWTTRVEGRGGEGCGGGGEGDGRGSSLMAPINHSCQLVPSHRSRAPGRKCALLETIFDISIIIHCEWFTFTSKLSLKYKCKCTREVIDSENFSKTGIFSMSVKDD